MKSLILAFAIAAPMYASAYTLCTNSADQREGIYYLNSGDNCPKYFRPDFAALGFRRTSRERCIFSSRKLGQNMICRSKLSIKQVEAISKRRRNLRDNTELKESISVWKDIEAALYNPNDINQVQKAEDTETACPCGPNMVDVAGHCVPDELESGEFDATAVTEGVK